MPNGLSLYWYSSIYSHCVNMVPIWRLAVNNMITVTTTTKTTKSKIDVVFGNIKFLYQNVKVCVWTIMLNFPPLVSVCVIHINLCIFLDARVCVCLYCFKVSSTFMVLPDVPTFSKPASCYTNEPIQMMAIAYSIIILSLFFSFTIPCSISSIKYLHVGLWNGH